MRNNNFSLLTSAKEFPNLVKFTDVLSAGMDPPLIVNFSAIYFKKLWSIEFWSPENPVRIYGETRYKTIFCKNLNAKCHRFISCISNGKFVVLVSLHFVYLHMYMLLCACTFHVNRLDL